MNTELSKGHRKKKSRRNKTKSERNELATNKACANSTMKQYC